ncbi:hypothetical protein ES319_A06G046300v1 [Gossypium barbadense]|uniref:Uncharacterized protein n=2 Tax=Gossypium TaxID=3633 RepID=A0A5J5V9D8_GOSBA|nr:hypothetical protein ES319_A06G046300v1 [Gossypium barbadense]TYH12217.1 hypothetical protein ES288_A06G049300v1 [Gossypium darwinii]
MEKTKLNLKWEFGANLEIENLIFKIPPLISHIRRTPKRRTEAIPTPSWARSQRHVHVTTESQVRGRRGL